jgi:hypothetical protein
MHYLLTLLAPFLLHYDETARQTLHQEYPHEKPLVLQI